MFKYEEEIQKRVEEFDWEGQFNAINSIFHGEREEENIELIFRTFQAPLNANCRMALKKHYMYDKTGVYKKEDNSLPVMSMPVADTSNLPHDMGLYFVGMIGINPAGQKYYLVKVGYSSDVHDRVGQYASYNPMLYVGGYVRTVSEEREKVCHAYLERRAIARAQNAKEWYYVDEKTYFELCDTFSNKAEFIKIALGMVE